ncbi:MAG: AbrB/MazE/SpoVT family DNA-binding domain-containing protein [Phycisphaeraceae bacterium]|nr:AbrB/MazE/SpoVT family DNA-binding domain-containing protein [Phycisphaeraceae bacterium]
MIKKLTKHGNSLALIIDKPILDLLKIDADTPLEVTTDGHGLRVQAAWDEQTRQRFETAAARGIEQYGDMLKRLAQ